MNLPGSSMTPYANDHPVANQHKNPIVKGGLIVPEAVHEELCAAHELTRVF